MDRNILVLSSVPALPVALRKESVDRNGERPRRVFGAADVALRKESVDRNSAVFCLGAKAESRSPQGERG